MSCCCLPTSLSVCVCVLCISLWRCLHTHLVPIRTAAASADVAASPASASAPASAARLGTRWYLELEQRSAHSTRRQRQPVSNNNNNNSNMFVIASNSNNNTVSAAAAACGAATALLLRLLVQAGRLCKVSDRKCFRRQQQQQQQSIGRQSLRAWHKLVAAHTCRQTGTHTGRQAHSTHTHTLAFFYVPMAIVARNNERKACSMAIALLSFIIDFTFLSVALLLPPTPTPSHMPFTRHPLTFPAEESSINFRVV